MWGQALFFLGWTLLLLFLEISILALVIVSVLLAAGTWRRLALGGVLVNSFEELQASLLHGRGLGANSLSVFLGLHQSPQLPNLGLHRISLLLVNL